MLYMNALKLTYTLYRALIEKEMSNFNTRVLLGGIHIIHTIEKQLQLVTACNQEKVSDVKLFMSPSAT